MKKIITQKYKSAFQENFTEEIFQDYDEQNNPGIPDPQINEKSDANIELVISKINFPENVVNALITALHENKDPYFQTYIRALPKTIIIGRQIGKEDDAIRSQIHYIYANMEEYENEEVKTIIADFLNIPEEDRLGHQDYEEEGNDGII